jgi:hypothetical protein
VARYAATVTSGTALAVNTAFAGVTGTAAIGCLIRRVTIGTVAGTSAVADQQLVVGFNRATALGTTSGTLTPIQLNPLAPAAACSLITSWSVQPTLGTNDFYRVAFNAKSGVDLPFELLEQLFVPAATATPVVFVNRVNAAPASTSYSITIETEE